MEMRGVQQKTEDGSQRMGADKIETDKQRLMQKESSKAKQTHTALYKTIKD